MTSRASTQSNFRRHTSYYRYMKHFARRPKQFSEFSQNLVISHSHLLSTAMVEITICAKTQPTLFGSRFKTQISGQEIVQDSGHKWDHFVFFRCCFQILLQNFSCLTVNALMTICRPKLKGLNYWHWCLIILIKLFCKNCGYLSPIMPLLCSFFGTKYWDIRVLPK